MNTVFQKNEVIGVVLYTHNTCDNTS